MGSWWDKTERSLPFKDKSSLSALSGETASLKREENGLSESRWAPATAIARRRGPATYTKSGPRVSNAFGSDDSTGAVTGFIVDPVLAIELKEKRDRETAGAAKRAEYGARRPKFTMLTSEEREDQRSLHTFDASEASVSKNLSDVEPTDADCYPLPSRLVPQDPRALADVEFDDDGDVIMADLEEWQAIREVAHVIAEDRASDRTGEGKPEVLAPGQRVDDATHVIVIDTSFILAHLSLVNDLVLSYLEWGCVVVLPWATIQELDGLKKSNRGIIGVNARNGGHQVDISMLARAANRWAFQVLSKPEPGIWGQTREEVIDGTFNHGDMAILDCARFFYDQGYDTYLLTNDFNLSVNAIIYKIKAFMYEKGQTCQSLLKKVYGRSRRPRYLPKPKGFLTQTAESKVVQGLEGCVGSRIELKAEQADSGLIQDAGAKAIAGILPPNLIRGRCIPAMPTRPYGGIKAFSGRLRSSSSEIVRLRQGPLGNGMAESIHAPRGREVRDVNFSGSYGNGMAESIHAPQGREARAANRPGCYVDSTTPTPTAVISTDDLSTLLLEIHADALSNFRVAIKHHVLDCFGDAVDYLKIHPEDQILSLYDLESFMLKHYITVFSEFIPRSTHSQLVSHCFSGKLYELEKFSRAPAKASHWLSVLEVLNFINALDSLWQMTSDGIPHLAGCAWPVQAWRRRANDLG